MNLPCEKCIILAVCKATAREKSLPQLIDKCSMLEKYIEDIKIYKVDRIQEIYSFFNFRYVCDQILYERMNLK